ncbi:MAG TPA: NAD-dependent DNA ligase LigA, partial [bacterium]|nr:NAD-dependent DNA ligase LigA [bacterium]
KQGITRGDGEYGDDITQNIKTIKSIPLKIEDDELSKLEFDVRGEVYMPKKIFSRLNDEREKEGLELFANPRNAAAGSLKQLDPKICAARKLDIFIHSSGYLENFEIQSHYDFLMRLKNIGFKINEHTKRFDTIREVIEYCKYWENRKHSLAYEIDGMVIKLDNLEYQKILGYTAKFPRWAIAYKFVPDRAQTKIKSVDMSVGRTGAITPVANFEPPVHLAGTIVKRATLHNEDYINELDIRLYDTVIVEKAGEIIPSVVAALKELRTGSERKIEFPKCCPVCGSIVMKFEGEAKYKCINPTCAAQVIRRIEYYCSKNFGVNISIGEKTIELLVNKNLIKNIADLYYLKIDDIVDLERFGKKSAENLINSIEQSKSAEFYKKIAGLGIEYIGPTAARLLTKYFNNIDELMNADIEKMAQSIVSFFKLDSVRKMIERMKQKNVKFENDRKIDSVAKLKDKIFVITGKLPSGRKRNELVDIIIKNGGAVASAINKTVDYLISGADESNSSKFKKAKELGIKIISETDFFELLK